MKVSRTGAQPAFLFDTQRAVLGRETGEASNPLNMPPTLTQRASPWNCQYTLPNNIKESRAVRSRCIEAFLCTSLKIIDQKGTLSFEVKIYSPTSWETENHPSHTDPTKSTLPLHRQLPHIHPTHHMLPLDQRRNLRNGCAVYVVLYGEPKQQKRA